MADAIATAQLSNDMEFMGQQVEVAHASEAERRRTSRFPLQEELRYRVLHKAGSSGIGKSLNIGSGGILFTTEEKLPVGRQVELSVNWPARLDGICPLKFVAMGRVVRSDSRTAAIRIERYEFRTRATSEGAKVLTAGS